MPQMAPINWLSLYCLFLSIFIMFIIMNYFLFLYKPNMHVYSKKIKKINWKW